MPERSELDEREKFDHSGHPLDRPKAGDLHAPGGAKAPPPDPGQRDSRGDPGP